MSAGFMTMGSTYELPDTQSCLEEFEDNQSVANQSEGENSAQENALAKKETKAVSWIRSTVLFVLVATTAAVSVGAYLYLRDSEQEGFETAIVDQAMRVIDAFQIASERRMGTMESFAASITSHAVFHNLTWPQVSVPQFERQATAAADLADVLSVLFVPLVTDVNRQDWETYAVANQGWLQESLSVQQETQLELEQQQQQQQQAEADAAAASSTRHRYQRSLQTTTSSATTSTTFQASPIPERITKIQGLDMIIDRGPGPYLPQWQMTPALPTTDLIQYNLLSDAGYHATLTALLEAETTIVGPSLDFSDDEKNTDSNSNSIIEGTTTTKRRQTEFDLILQRWQDIGQSKEYELDPVADVLFPIFDGYDRNTRRLVGLVSCMIYWRTYFLNILPDNTSMDVVLENTCDQTYTYALNGPQVTFLGNGDLHNTKYTDLVTQTEPGAFLGDAVTYNLAARQDVDKEGSCLYSIRVYPNQELENVFLTIRPALYTFYLVLIFVFTSGVFILYDTLVERRQRVVMNTAVASSAIVSSLFPKVVRDRLYDQGGGGGAGGAATSGGGGPTTGMGATDADSSQHRLQNYLQSDGTAEGGGEMVTSTRPTGGGANAVQISRPIADLFEDCTVLFADIVGFTSWCCGREPTDVFFLLETIYGAYDKIASKRNVFKVETIGDCYLAVTGLPDPQKDHAIRMSLFAHECLRQMKLLMLNELKKALGGATSTLSMRFGLHSGPVTAGVLRGEKSRFQLFGDTVNTAARMESTGRRHKIQVSVSTADLLVEAGKGHWLEDRREMIEAKGKGKMKTYWLHPRAYQPSKDERNNARMLEAVRRRKGKGEDGQQENPSGAMEVELSEAEERAQVERMVAELEEGSGSEISTSLNDDDKKSQGSYEEDIAAGNEPSSLRMIIKAGGSRGSSLSGLESLDYSSAGDEFEEEEQDIVTDKKNNTAPTLNAESLSSSSTTNNTDQLKQPAAATVTTGASPTTGADGDGDHDAAHAALLAAEAGDWSIFNGASAPAPPLESPTVGNAKSAVADNPQTPHDDPDALNTTNV